MAPVHLMSREAFGQADDDRGMIMMKINADKLSRMADDELRDLYSSVLMLLAFAENSQELDIPLSQILREMRERGL